MKLVAISDTHNKHKQIKEFRDAISRGEEVGGDVIIHAGDATGRGEKGEVEAFLKWYGSLDFRHRLFTPGNHDWLFERSPELGQELCDQYGVTLLHNKEVIIDDVKFYGSAVTPWFHSWAFNVARGPDIAKEWAKIPDDTNVLITHGPVYGIHDIVPYVDGTPKERVGCHDLYERVMKLEKLKMHFCGHIHHSHGYKYFNGKQFYNVSICDEMYMPTNPITIIDYEKD